MRDQRVTFYRKTLEQLIESLEASVRVTQWNGGEAVPQPLKESAGQLIVRLGTADRLASSTFKGTIADVAKVDALLGAIRRLDAAYVAYRQTVKAKPGELEHAASALGGEIDGVKAEALRWG